MHCELVCLLGTLWKASQKLAFSVGDWQEIVCLQRIQCPLVLLKQMLQSMWSRFVLPLVSGTCVLTSEACIIQRRPISGAKSIGP